VILTKSFDEPNQGTNGTGRPSIAIVAMVILAKFGIKATKIWF
jgi:hypothetical protein